MLVLDKIPHPRPYRKHRAGIEHYLAYPHDDRIHAGKDEERRADVKQYGLYLAVDVGGEHQPLRGGHRPEHADRQLAREDESSEQRDDEPVIGEKLETVEIHYEEKHHDDDYLVRQRIEEFAQRRYCVGLARDVPVHEVRGTQNRKKHARYDQKRQLNRFFEHSHDIEHYRRNDKEYSCYRDFCCKRHTVLPMRSIPSRAVISTL